MKHKKLKCAIIEYENFHDQVYPIFVYALNRLNVEVNIYTTRRNIKKNAFFYDDKNLLFKFKNIEWRDRFGLEKFFKYRKYDLVLFNTFNFYFQNKNALENYSIVCKRDILKIGVIHEGRFVQNNSQIKRFCEDGNHIITLSKHISKYIESFGIKSNWILPVYFGNVTKKSFNKITFCVQGIIAPQRKNYKPLIEGIKFLKQRGEKEFQILFVGRNSDKNAETFKKILKDEGIKDVCLFTKGDISYDVFLRLINSSDFIIMLVDCDKKNETFHNSKLTSALFYVIGLNIIPIVNEVIAMTYDIADCGITYKNNNMKMALLSALNLQKNQKKQFIKKLKDKKSYFLKESINQMGKIIKSIT